MSGGADLSKGPEELLDLTLVMEEGCVTAFGIYILLTGSPPSPSQSSHEAEKEDTVGENTSNAHSLLLYRENSELLK